MNLIEVNQQPSLDKLMEIFTENPRAYKASELVKLSGFTRQTVQASLATLVALGKIEKGPYQQRVGHLYTPVDEKSTGARFTIDNEVYDLEGLLSWLNNAIPPHSLITDKWAGGLQKLLIMAVFQSRVEYSDANKAAIRARIIELRDESVRLARILNGFLSDDIWDSVAQANIERELYSLDWAMNFYTEKVEGKTPVDRSEAA